MKKLALIIAIVFMMGLGAFAQDGGLLNRGISFNKQEQANRDGMMNLPNHGETTDQDSPLGSGVAVLLGLGAAYLIGKKRNEE